MPPEPVTACLLTTLATCQECFLHVTHCHACISHGPVRGRLNPTFQMRKSKPKKSGSLSKVTQQAAMDSRSWALAFNPEGPWLSPFLESSFRS